MTVNDGEFQWAVGIEDTFIPQVQSRTGRTLDEYDLTRHYEQWRSDLDLVASLNVRAMRYGIPWYRVNPAPGVFDWAWMDEVLEYMVCDLGIHPIVDLVHYGCPLWMERPFLDPEYPRLVSEYARAFVERYHTLTHFYTPLNEPLVNASFCGHSGVWPPYLRGPKGYARVLTALAHGMSLTVEAIRAVQPDATIVQAEATSCIVADDPALAGAVEDRWKRQFLPNDMLLGRVGPDHRLRQWLIEHGAPVAALDHMTAHPQEIDVIGANFYPGMNCWRLGQRGGKTTARRYYGGTEELDVVLRRYHEHYERPIMITETSTTGPVRRREGWMDDSLRLVRELREEGVPITGYTWWPLFSLIKWAFRAGSKPVDSYLVHMGLWDLRGGDLSRDPTQLVERYAWYVANTRETVGKISALTTTLLA